MLTPTLQKNDKQARILIAVFSFVVFAAVTVLAKIKLDVNLGFDVHVFALINAILNSVIAVLLVGALWAVKTRRYNLHKRMMLASLWLSIAFLVSYITHHLLSDQTLYGDVNHDNLVDAAEKAALGAKRMVYFIILITHIFLAAVILPFILFTAYRGLTAEFPAHKKLARITWPLWFYVAVTGPVVYIMISPYYT